MAYVTHPRIKPDSVEERRYQTSVVEGCVARNSLVILPTGLGKTIVALRTVAEFIDSGKVLILAPTKPLVDQHRSTFEELMPSARVGMLNGMMKPEKRAVVVSDSDIVISTPQCVANDLESRLYDLRDFSLCIFDEAHRATGNYAYVAVAPYCPVRCRMIGMTASPGSDLKRIEEVCDNLDLRRIDVRSDDDPDVAPYVFDTYVNRIEVNLPKDLQDAVQLLREMLDRYVAELSSLGLLPRGQMVSKGSINRLQENLQVRLARGEKTAIVFRGMTLAAICMKLLHAIEYAECQGMTTLRQYLSRLEAESLQEKGGKGAREIMARPEYPKLRFILDTTRVEHPKVSRVMSIVSQVLESKPGTKVLVFAQFRDTCDMLVDKISGIPHADPGLLIGHSNGGMNQKDQIGLLDRFRSGELNVLVSTSVGEEGLDVASTDAVIFYEPIPSDIRTIQRRGRTGRKNDGEVYVLVGKGTLDEVYEKAAKDKERAMRERLQRLSDQLGSGQSKIVRKTQTNLDGYRIARRPFSYLLRGVIRTPTDIINVADDPGMLYSELAETFDRLESTTSRLEMATIMAGFFRTVDPKELRGIVYLSQGKLHPDFFPQVLGMSDKLVLKAIAIASGHSEKEIEGMWIKTGDPGEVAEKMMATKKQMALFSEELTVSRLIAGLTSIENASGKDSQDKKMKTLANLLHDSGPLEARYLCRIVTGRMRVGAGDMTILDALAEAFATKEGRPAIERAFNVTCDIGLVAETVAVGGMEAISKVGVTVGSPVKVMLAERLQSISEVVEKMGGRCAMEYKYDGIRVQAHIGKDGVKLYSRRLEDLTSNFPDIADELRAKCKCQECIVEGECVAIDPETGYMLPFQNVTHRRRKNDMDSAVKEVPVRIFLFDILYDGEDRTGMAYPDRRSLLESTFAMGGMIQTTTMRVVESPEEGEDFFAGAIANRCEGIMAKSLSPESVYRAGSRGFLWIKYKKDYQQALTDSFDLAVVGAFYGMGKRAGKYGALLMAAYDPDSGRFQTVCKLGTGFDDAFLDGMPELLNGTLSEGRPRLVDAEMIPDVWFDPAVVLEVVAAEITLSPIHTAAWDVIKEGAGLGIRFPRFTGRVRDDKDPEQCTTVGEIVEMYGMQAHDSDGLSERGYLYSLPETR